VSNIVYLTKVIDDDIFGALSRLISKLDFPEYEKKIGIKINLADYRKRETGVTTDPVVLDPLLKILRDKYPSSEIYLFESDATGTLVDNLYKWLGLDAIAEKYDVNFINLSREKWIRLKIDGYHFKKIDVPDILLDSMIVNHPKLKTHGRTKLTCGLKNIYGCYRIKEKVKYHSFLDEAIVDVNLAIKSHFTVVDGYWGVEGNRGPTQGYPKKVGVFIGGEDVVAVDSFCARFMGFNPRSIGHIVKAQRKKIGRMKYNIDSEIAPEEFRKYRFEFSMLKFWMMQVLRRVVQ